MGRGQQQATLEAPTQRRSKAKAAVETSAAEPAASSAVFTPIIDPSTPDFYKAILEAEDEDALLKRLPKSHTYGEYVVIMHRISQLREQHAVTGLLSSSVYAKAKAEAEAVKVRLDEAEAELAGAQAELAAYLAEIEKTLDDDAISAQVEGERVELESELLGYEWRYRLALDAFDRHPDVIALRAEIEKLQRRAAHGTVSNDKKLKELQLKLRKSIISKGPTHADTLALLAEKEKLSSGDSDADTAAASPEVTAAEKKLETLQLQLLGKLKTDKKSGERTFAGGTLDLTDAFEQAREEIQLTLEVRLLERIAEIRRSNLQGGEAAEKVAAAKAAVVTVQAEYDQVAAKVHVHEAALERAKRRAERARQKIVRFEPQQLGKELEHELQQRSRQARALFVTDSKLKDNILYVASKGHGFEAFAEIVDGNDKAFIEKMKKAGATVTANDAVKTSSSYYNLPAGNRYTIKLDGKAAIHYVPHSSLNGANPIMSERGMLRVEGLKPEAAAKALEDLGLHAGLAEAVPYELIYRGTHRAGRVLPHHEPLASGREALKMPDGGMVIHGVTGAGGGDAAIKRLELIVESGGLKSIAERRRMGIDVSSTCPESDTMEGIDMGVPTQIRKDTCYGSHMWLLMHPEIVNRRDCFFVPSGSGYTTYAKTIGQGTIHDPAPVSGRQKHLDSVLSHGGNEWYFHHEISWNEVDTILVSEEIYSQVVSKVATWKQQGLLPDNVRVDSTAAEAEPVDDKLKKGGWQVDEASGEIFYEEEDLTQVKQETGRSGAAYKIQKRARELARSLD